jgi:hypothetical protein
MSAVLRWVEGPDDSVIARLGSTGVFYQAIPVLDDYQLVLATPGGVLLLGTHPTLEAAKATAVTHVGDDE